MIGEVMNGNVYANSAGSTLTSTTLGNFSTTGQFTSTMSAAPVAIPGLGAYSWYGTTLVAADGTPTATLQAGFGSAIPADAEINQYLAAGARVRHVTALTRTGPAGRSLDRSIYHRSCVGGTPTDLVNRRSSRPPRQPSELRD